MNHRIRNAGPTNRNGGFTRKLLCVPLILVTLTAPSQEPAPSGHADAIRSYLQPLLDSHTLAGAVTLVATRDRLIYLQSAGYRDLSEKAMMPTNAMFWIASTSKPMTVTAFMMLVDEGKVSLTIRLKSICRNFTVRWSRPRRMAIHRMGRLLRSQRLQPWLPRSSDSGPRNSEPHQRPAVQVLGSAGRARHVIVERLGT